MVVGNVQQDAVIRSKPALLAIYPAESAAEVEQYQNVNSQTHVFNLLLLVVDLTCIHES